MKKRQPRVFVAEPVESRLLMASVSGIVYNDVNVNHVYQAGDPLMSNIRVYVDLGNHGSYQSGDPNAMTKMNGAYTIKGLAAGMNYDLRVTAPTGFRQTEPQNNAPYVVKFNSAGAAVTGDDFGLTQKVRMSGYVFADLNNDGKQDDGEPAYPGVTVYIDENGSNHYVSSDPHTTSTSSGYWVIGDLPPNKTYTARIVVPRGYVQTNPANGRGYGATLGDGKTADNIHFGIRYAPVIYTEVFNDADDYVGPTEQEDPSTDYGKSNVTDTLTINGGTATSNLFSDVEATEIRGIASFSEPDLHNAAFATIFVKFTVTSATTYSTGYDVFGNAVQYKLTGPNNTPLFYLADEGGSGIPVGSTKVGPSDSFSGTLQPGNYSLQFGAGEGMPASSTGFLFNFIFGA